MKTHKITRRLAVGLRMITVAAALATIPARVPLAAPSLSHLRGIGEVRDWFNAGKGHVRLILLLSPT
jgi:hypothetical protein